MNEYKINADFRRYIDRYARNNEISVTEALHHKLIKETEAYYREKMIARG